MFYVYILELSNKKFYIGQTSNLKDRLNRHKAAQLRSTKAFLPVRLVYSENLNSRSEAMKREKYLKLLKSHKALLRIINLDGDTASSSNG